MINTLLKRLLNMLLLLAFQVLILNHVQISGYGTPLVFACMILYMPMGSVRTGILLWGSVPVCWWISSVIRRVWPAGR